MKSAGAGARGAARRRASCARPSLTRTRPRYGYRDEQAEVELVNLRVVVWGAAPAARACAPARAARRGARADARRVRRERVEAELARRAAAGHRVRGPGAVRAARVDAARPAGLGGRRSDRARHDPRMPTRSARGVSLDPIELQVMTGALRAACEEMGAVLIRSAHSANIKERRDASTAPVRRDGRDGDAGRAHPRAPRRDAGRRGGGARRATMRRGVSWILNDPFAGGTHLPDITVITPVFAPARALIGFAASRAHHADVGGRVPGSMPADSRTLEEEGVVIAPRPLDERGDRGARGADAPARGAPRRPARAARGQPHRRPAPRRAGRARGRRAPARGDRRGARLLPSGARAPASPRCPTACARPRTCWRRPRAISSCACAPTVEGERLCSTSRAAPPSTRETSTARSR